MADAGDTDDNRMSELVVLGFLLFGVSLLCMAGSAFLICRQRRSEEVQDDSTYIACIAGCPGLLAAPTAMLLALEVSGVPMIVVGSLALTAFLGICWSISSIAQGFIENCGEKHYGHAAAAGACGLVPLLTSAILLIVVGARSI